MLTFVLHAAHDAPLDTAFDDVHAAVVTAILVNWRRDDHLPRQVIVTRFAPDGVLPVDHDVVAVARDVRADGPRGITVIESANAITEALLDALRARAA